MVAIRNIGKCNNMVKKMPVELDRFLRKRRGMLPASASNFCPILKKDVSQQHSRKSSGLWH